MIYLISTIILTKQLLLPIKFKSKKLVKIGLGNKQYHIEIAIKCTPITMISSGHFYSIWINLTAYHKADINATRVVSVRVVNKCFQRVSV